MRGGVEVRGSVSGAWGLWIRDLCPTSDPPPSAVPLAPLLLSVRMKSSRFGGLDEEFKVKGFGLFYMQGSGCFFEGFSWNM